MLNITYIFSTGRKKKIESNKIQSQEFFYGYFYFKNLGHNLNIIEFEKRKNILSLFDKVMNKLFSLPFNTSSLTLIKNFKKIRNLDYLFLVNEKVAFSAIFLLIFKKIFFNKTKVILFSMGLYSKKMRLNYFKFVHHIFIKFLILLTDYVIFLGKGEYMRAKEFNKNSNKLHFVPFGIDTSFWKSSKSYVPKEKDYILFIGNDGNRDYELLKKLVLEFSNFNFKIVTSHQNLLKLEAPNAEVIEGNWNSDFLDDKSLKKIYEDCKAVIIPLKESFQPSGQSVSLQAMSLKIPVAITTTQGFWDDINFKNHKNIIFVDGYTISAWKEFFHNIVPNDELLLNISGEGYKIVKDNYNLDNFNKKIFNIINKKESN